MAPFLCDILSFALTWAECEAYGYTWAIVHERAYTWFQFELAV